MSHRQRLLRPLALIASVATAAALAPQLAASATPTSSESSRPGINPVFERTVGGPGHAGLYAWGMATAKDGSILVGDYWNYRVMRFNTSGQPVGSGVFIKNNGNGATQYYTPYGLGVDPRNGNVYLADTDRFQIDVYSAGGGYLRSFGGKGAGTGKYLYPSRVAVGSTGKVYVSDTWDHRVVMTSETGTELDSVGGFGSGNGQLRSPHGLALDAANNVYVVDPGNFRIQVFDQNLNFLRKWGSKGSMGGQFQGDMRGIAVDKARGFVYVVDGQANKIHKFDLQGRFLLKWGSQGYGNGQFADGGREITVDNAGNVWVADMPNFRVQKFSPTGAFLGQFPTVGQDPPLGRFNAPRGVAVHSDGTIAVSDTYNWRIQTFTNGGSFIKAWGKRGRGPYLFNYARMLAFNPTNGDIIVTDTDNGRIHAYTKAGVYRWAVGEAGSGPNNFRNPQAVAVAANGTIYVADSNNMRIQVLSPNGAILRSFGTGAQLTYPKGVAVDPTDQSVWVADSVRRQVTHWSAAGGFLGAVNIPRGGGDSQMGTPFGIAVDSERIYVADVPVHSVKVWNKSGQFVTKIGQRGEANGKFLQPAQLTIQGGKLYVAEEGNERISIFRLNAN